MKLRVDINGLKYYNDIHLRISKDSIIVDRCGDYIISYKDKVLIEKHVCEGFDGLDIYENDLVEFWEMKPVGSGFEKNKPVQIAIAKMSDSRYKSFLAIVPHDRYF